MEMTRKAKIISFITNYAIYIVFAILVIGMSMADERFLNIDNLSNILLQSSVIGCVAVGMTFVIIVQGMDVSVGSIVALSSVCSVFLMVEKGVSPILGIVIVFAVALTVEAFNGFSAAYLKMPPFIVTLATMQIARGLANQVCGGQSIYNLPPLIKAIGNTTIGPIPLPIFIFAACAILGHILLSKTVLGKQLYATGGNPKAAEMSGINTKRIVFAAFMILGVFVAIASLTITGRMNSYYPTMGTSYEFDAIASCVIGGTSLMGGVGTIPGTVVGVLILGVINNALNILGISPFMQLVFKGLIIFVAVMIDTLKNKAKEIA